MAKKWLVAVLLLAMAGVPAFAQKAGNNENKPVRPHEHGPLKYARESVMEYPLRDANVYILPVQGAMMADLAFKFHRMAEKAKIDADAVVLDIDTPGGDINTLSRMLEDVKEFECPVFAYVNPQAFSAGSMLSLGADIIVMDSPSTIGGAYPITSTGQEVGGGSEAIEEKILSFTRGLMRSTALSRGHDPDLAQRMTDPKHPLPNYPNLVRDGQLLVLDQDQATSVGLAAFQADDIDELLNRAGYVSPSTTTVELTWSEEMAGYLVNPVVSGVLLLIALAAFYLEFKTPGVGIPAAVGLVAILLFFWGGMLADLAGYWEVALFFIGLLLLAAEIFVIPGFGVAGVAGVLCILTSFVLGMAQLPTEGFEPVNLSVLETPMMVMGLTLLSAVPVFVLITKLLPETPLFRSLVTDASKIPQAAAVLGVAKSPKWVGKQGKAMTDLRPSGVALIDDQRVDVVTHGDYIRKGAIVKVIEEHGNVYQVIEVEPPAKEPEPEF